MKSLSGRLRPFVGVALGACTGLVALGYLLAAGAAVALTAGRARPRLGAVARWLAEIDRRRVVRFYGPTTSGAVTTAGALAYLAARVAVGLFGGLLYGLLLWGGVTVLVLWIGWILGWPVDGIEATPLIVAYLIGLAAVLAFLNLSGIAALARADRWVAVRLLGPGPREAYERRIAELSTARLEVVAAVDAERRRIERDLHDGVQQRLVAVGMLLGRARRLPPADGRLSDLLRQAHDEAADALVELREVSWRVFPAALDAGGLPVALETVADRSPVPVTLSVELDERPVSAVETVAYFVVSEAVTNAIKHAAASRVDVAVRRTGEELRVVVHDDGTGGAEPSGTGLTGLSRRVSALDGRFRVDSPAGGPTTIEAVLPCV
ncbi:sensor histidine kinase [Cryptosporangium aurantiacum]|uniref:histidine kinase n=1 Tax=Cryptosporangium aurantiacum TaxID=134849 RepID=A0A1M7RPX7_9ACTN|nr:sensor histidine kinase [Cryptosporangium aurantiacum]SHN48108.1 Signal transduction histidine kinase [Cryptosporangium aurantiacum]